VELALEEALTNVCNYAYDGEAGDVEARCILDDVSDGLVVEIIDSGKPFNPLDAPEPNLTPEVERRQMGGLGVLLISKIANDVRYQRLENQNLLRLFFRRQGRDE
jgi:anti-sigma regulatory factor (Ser/Thr protein kinase)